MNVAERSSGDVCLSVLGQDAEPQVDPSAVPPVCVLQWLADLMSSSFLMGSMLTVGVKCSGREERYINLSLLPFNPNTNIIKWEHFVSSTLKYLLYSIVCRIGHSLGSLYLSYWSPLFMCLSGFVNFYSYVQQSCQLLKYLQHAEVNMGEKSISIQPGLWVVKRYGNIFMRIKRILTRLSPPLRKTWQDSQQI